MSLDHVQCDMPTINCDVDVTSPSISTVMNLLSKTAVLKFLFGEGPVVHAKRFMPISISQPSRMVKYAEDECITVSGSLDTQYLGQSTHDVHECPLVPMLFFIYGGTLDCSITKAHFLNTVEKS